MKKSVTNTCPDSPARQEARRQEAAANMATRKAYLDKATGKTPVERLEEILQKASAKR